MGESQRMTGRCRVRYRVWMFVHNVVAHPLLEVLPARHGDAFHDWTIRMAERKP